MLFKDSSEKKLLIVCADMLAISKIEGMLFLSLQSTKTQVINEMIKKSIFKAADGIWRENIL